ncbi:MAG: GGDEF domain-containing protein [Pseudomonadaceae bacterium]|nr:GGDEF domain-containing protein [Pseudomonadaceae bacterium]
MRIRTKKDVWICTASIVLISVLCALTGVLSLYLVAGVEAFHLQNVIAMAAVLPIVIASPITYYVACTSLKLTQTQAELRLLAETDDLTRLPNRRSFFRQAHAMLETQTVPASLMVIDADHFKELNDSYGHAVGDRALVAIADILRSSFRHNDLLCRVGGEEFAVLVSGMDADQANILANRVVKKISANPLMEPGAIIEFSVSCGIADTHTSRNLPTLFKAADDAMYMAKQQGRNRVALLHRAA